MQFTQQQFFLYVSEHHINIWNHPICPTFFIKYHERRHILNVHFQCILLSGGQMITSQLHF